MLHHRLVAAKVSSKERSVQKLPDSNALKTDIFNMAWSCLTIKSPAVLKLIVPGRWNGCGGYSPSGVKERTGLVSLLLSRLASRLQPWLTLGRGIRLPLADPPPRKHQKKSREKHKDKEEQKHWKSTTDRQRRREKLYLKHWKDNGVAHILKGEKKRGPKTEPWGTLQKLAK